MKIMKTSNYIKISETQKEKEDFFRERTNKHIDRVQNAAEKIVDEYEEYRELLEQVKNHDASKFKEPELTPYIELTWSKKQNQDDDGGIDIEKATLHHVKNNKHHPEYHLEDKSEANISSGDRDKSDKCIDAKNMDDISVAEMVADWQAMSEELKTNTAREWYNDVKDIRWSFSKKQEELIDKLLKIFNK